MRECFFRLFSALLIGVSSTGAWAQMSEEEFQTLVQACLSGDGKACLSAGVNEFARKPPTNYGMPYFIEACDLEVVDGCVFALGLLDSVAQGNMERLRTENPEAYERYEALAVSACRLGDRRYCLDLPEEERFILSLEALLPERNDANNLWYECLHRSVGLLWFIERANDSFNALVRGGAGSSGRYYVEQHHRELVMRASAAMHVSINEILKLHYDDTGFRLDLSNDRDIRMYRFFTDFAYYRAREETGPRLEVGMDSLLRFGAPSGGAIGRFFGEVFGDFLYVPSHGHRECLGRLHQGYGIPDNYWPEATYLQIHDVVGATMEDGFKVRGILPEQAE